MLLYNCPKGIRAITRKEKGEQMEVMNEKEIKIVKNSTIYEIRLAFASGEKEDYKKEEILEMLDKIALAKEQE